MIQSRKHPVAFGNEGLSGMGQPDLGVRALEQKYLELLFQLSDGTAQRGLRDIQRARGASEVQRLRHLAEVLQPPEACLHLHVCVLCG